MLIYDKKSMKGRELISATFKIAKSALTVRVHGRSQPKTWGGIELEKFDFTSHK